MAGHATRRLVTHPIRDRDRFRVEEDGPATGLTVPFHRTNRRFGRFDELGEGSKAGGRRPGRAGGRRGVRIFEPGGPVSRRVVAASVRRCGRRPRRGRAWFATSVLDNALTIEDKRAKARLRGEVARKLWGWTRPAAATRPRTASGPMAVPARLRTRGTGATTNGWAAIDTDLLGGEPGTDGGPPVPPVTGGRLGR